MRLSPSRVLHHVSDLLLGTEPKQRVRVSRSLLALATYWALLLVHRLVMAFGLDFGGPELALPGIVAWSIGPLAFCALTRSGWSRRLADPSMTQAQTVYAFGAVMLDYAVSPHTRAASLLVAVLVLAFGAFRLTAPQTLRLAALATLMLGAEMLALAHLQPVLFPMPEQLAHLLLIAFVLPMVALIAGHTTAIRRKRQLRHRELELALQAVERLATQDALTGLMNRRRMQAAIATELARRARGQAPFTLALLDIDRFKRINDTHGHGVGDAVLQSFAQQIACGLREVDAAARWGGEEFIVLLPDTSADQAGAIVDRLRTRLAEIACLPGAPPGAVTFSAGVAEHLDGEALEHLFDRVDRALYRAKDSGRDRTCTASSEPVGFGWTDAAPLGPGEGLAP